ncbi:MAG: sigma-54 dependent transcriptional regulator [Fibrobacteraceae bacterium]|nr:sigma-54 dependent transcriptional regulator [Fibrobacteraceae bacterium]
MNDVTRLLEIASKSSVPVLLCGESGTGKEVAARNLHLIGARSKGPFIPVNCGALNPGLIESLFEGSCRGAFTGSVSNQLGFVRAADKGTLFLDEIGELPLESQTRLLRILQERSVTPVGSQISIPVDFRLVCATHRNLEDAVKNGRFREDLFFRLNVFPIHLLPLRDRQGELKTIAAELWSELSPRSLNAEELQKLMSFPWPGNVRQLKNVLNRYCLLECLGNSLDSVLASEPWDLHSLRSYSVGEIRQGYRCRSVSPSWNRIESVLNETSSNKSRAAKILGISRGALCYQVRKHFNGSKAS